MCNDRRFPGQKPYEISPDIDVTKLCINYFLNPKSYRYYAHI